ncbi:MAG TPA: hypothetical protein VFZ25_13650 [Chloroflexota bacterium]|nr:hypothetical protein [Chloroflexota bacterium]
MIDLRKGGIVAAVLVALAFVGARSALPRLRPIGHPTLAAIHYQTDSYVGQRVELEGTVRAFTDSSGTYYVLEDAQQNRILLQSTDPLIQARVDKSLRATGTVGYREGLGIYLDVESVAIPSG